MSFEPEQGLVILLVFAFIFLGINVNPDLGYIYALMIIGFYVMIDDVPLKYRLFKGTPKYLEAAVYGLVAYVGFYFGSAFIINLIPGLGLATGETVQGLTYTYLQAALTESEIVRNLSYGVLIPIVETIAFFGALPLIYSKFAGINPTFNLRDPKIWMLIAFISAAFTIFHLTAKGITNIKALAISFIFAVASMLLVLYRQQWVDAVMLHIINNLHALDVFDF